MGIFRSSKAGMSGNRVRKRRVAQQVSGPTALLLLAVHANAPAVTLPLPDFQQNVAATSPSDSQSDSLLPMVA